MKRRKQVYSDPVMKIAIIPIFRRPESCKRKTPVIGKMRMYRSLMTPKTPNAVEMPLSSPINLGVETSANDVPERGVNTAI